MSAPAMLIVTMEAPADMEDEFNDWYDLEHFPQRRGLPGFGDCTRWVCVQGWPRYIALYDLGDASAVETPEYLACSGPGATPWSRRVLPRTLGRQRVVATEIMREGATRPGRECRLLAARYPTQENDAGIALARQRLPGLVEARCLREGGDLWVLARFDRPVSLAALIERFGAAGDAGATLFNLYTPYIRGP
jgi:hypothetical protein